MNMPTKKKDIRLKLVDMHQFSHNGRKKPLSRQSKINGVRIFSQLHIYLVEAFALSTRWRYPVLGLNTLKKCKLLEFEC